MFICCLWYKALAAIEVYEVQEEMDFGSVLSPSINYRDFPVIVSGETSSFFILYLFVSHGSGPVFLRCSENYIDVN